MEEKIELARMLLLAKARKGSMLPHAPLYGRNVAFQTERNVSKTYLTTFLPFWI